MDRRSLLGLAVLASAGLAPALARAEGPADPAQFIDGLIAQALAALRDHDLAEAERERRFSALLAENFDVPRIARFALGRYWADASEDERRRFAALLESWVVRTYSSRLAQYGQEKVSVTGTRRESDTSAVVASVIVHPQGPPTKVDWRVTGGAGHFRIADIDVEGVSMALTEREEIAAVIQRSGGTVAGLNRTLAEKLHGDADASR